MKIKCLIAGALTLAVTGGAYAQGQFWSGQLMSQSTFNYTDIVKLSQFSNNFSTARTAAMGGAFTSLGADLSAMSINPAGLGLYRSSDFGITPAMVFSNMHNSGPEGIYGSDNTDRRFALNNFGIALNGFEGTGTLTSVTFGIGYNKVADFNYRSAVGLAPDGTTIGDVFLGQLDGIKLRDIKGDAPWQYDSRVPVDRWGAVLGYKSTLIDPLDPDDLDNTGYYMPTVATDAAIGHYALTESRGCIGEYNLSAGFNFSNRFYLGFSLGIQSIFMEQQTFYDEQYTDNSGAVDPATTLYYDQFKSLSGAAVNFKVGAIIRPIDGLRIGLAVHTPSWGDVNMKYYSSMNVFYPESTVVHPYGEEDAASPVAEYDYKYATPTRLLGGASINFGSVAMITADYEYSWYDDMKYNNDDNYRDYANEEIKYLFGGMSTVRAGVELRPTKNLALRAGASYSTAPFKKDAFDVDLDSFDSPVGYESYSLSAGLGFNVGKSVYFDLAYVYMNTKYTKYDLYYYTNFSDYEVGTGGINSNLDRHNVMASLGLRF